MVSAAELSEKLLRHDVSLPDAEKVCHLYYDKALGGQPTIKLHNGIPCIHKLGGEAHDAFEDVANKRLEKDQVTALKALAMQTTQGPTQWCQLHEVDLEVVQTHVMRRIYEKTGIPGPHIPKLHIIPAAENHFFSVGASEQVTDFISLGDVLCEYLLSLDIAKTYKWNKRSLKGLLGSLQSMFVDVFFSSCADYPEINGVKVIDRSILSKMQDVINERFAEGNAQEAILAQLVLHLLTSDEKVFHEGVEIPLDSIFSGIADASFMQDPDWLGLGSVFGNFGFALGEDGQYYPVKIDLGAARPLAIIEGDEQIQKQTAINMVGNSFIGKHLSSIFCCCADPLQLTRSYLRYAALSDNDLVKIYRDSFTELEEEYKAAGKADRYELDEYEDTIIEEAKKRLAQQKQIFVVQLLQAPEILEEGAHLSEQVRETIRAQLTANPYFIYHRVTHGKYKGERLVDIKCMQDILKHLMQGLVGELDVLISELTSEQQGINHYFAPAPSTANNFSRLFHHKTPKSATCIEKLKQPLGDFIASLQERRDHIVGRRTSDNLDSKDWTRTLEMLHMARSTKIFITQAKEPGNFSGALSQYQADVQHIERQFEQSSSDTFMDKVRYHFRRFFVESFNAAKIWCQEKIRASFNTEKRMSVGPRCSALRMAAAAA